MKTTPTLFLAVTILTPNFALAHAGKYGGLHLHPETWIAILFALGLGFGLKKILNRKST